MIFHCFSLFFPWFRHVSASFGPPLKDMELHQLHEQRELLRGDLDCLRRCHAELEQRTEAQRSERRGRRFSWLLSRGSRRKWRNTKAA